MKVAAFFFISFWFSTFSSTNKVWVEYASTDGKIYYYNSITGKSQWSIPQGDGFSTVDEAKRLPLLQQYLRPKKPHHFKTTAVKKNMSDIVEDTNIDKFPNNSINSTENEDLTAPALTADKSNGKGQILDYSFDTSIIMEALEIFFYNKLSSIEIKFDDDYDDESEKGKFSTDAIYYADKNTDSTNYLLSALLYFKQRYEELDAYLDDKEMEMQALFYISAFLITRIDEKDLSIHRINQDYLQLRNQLESSQSESYSAIKNKESIDYEPSVRGIDNLQTVIETLAVNITQQISLRHQLESELSDLDLELQSAYDDIDRLQSTVQALKESTSSAAMPTVHITPLDTSDSLLSRCSNLFFKCLQLISSPTDLTIKKRRNYRDWINSMKKAARHRGRQQNVSVAQILPNETNSEVELLLPPTATHSADDNYMILNEVVSNETEASTDSVVSVNMTLVTTSSNTSCDAAVVVNQSLPKNTSYELLDVLTSENVALRSNLSAMQFLLDSKSEALQDLSMEVDGYLTQAGELKKKCIGLSEQVAQLTAEKASVAAELDQREKDLQQLDNRYEEQTISNNQLLNQLEQTLQQSQSSEQRLQQAVFDSSARFSELEQRFEEECERSASQAANIEQLTTHLRDQLEYQERLRGQLLNASLQIAELRRQQAVSLVDGMQQHLLQNQPHLHKCSYSNQTVPFNSSDSTIIERCQHKRRKIFFGLF